MSKGSLGIKTTESEDRLYRHDLNGYNQNVKISPPNMIKDDMISLLDDVKSKKNYKNKEKEERITKISFYLGKIFDKQIDKIQRNYSMSRDRKKENSSACRNITTDRPINMNNHYISNKGNNRLHQMDATNVKSFLNCQLENIRKSKEQNIYPQRFNTNNESFDKNNGESVERKNINLKTDEYIHEINNKRVIPSNRLGLPPKNKRPPKFTHNYSSYDHTNTRSKIDFFTFQNFNFSIVNDSLKYGEPYSFTLDNNKKKTYQRKESHINSESKEALDIHHNSTNLIICNEQESLSIKQVKHKANHEMSFNIIPLPINALTFRDQANKTEQNHPSKGYSQITYKKPKISSSLYKSNKENQNIIANNHVYNHISYLSENSKINSKSLIEKDTYPNTIRLENTNLYKKISSLNSTFLDYELSNLNKIRIVSNKPSMNMSHVENESIDETSIHTNSQCMDVNGVTYISEGIKNYTNSSTLEKSKNDEKNISFKPHKNNSSILNIQSPCLYNTITDEIPQINSENSSLSIYKEIELKKTENFTNNMHDRKLIDNQLKKDFNSFILKRIKNHTVDYDRYRLKDDKLMSCNHFSTLSIYDNKDNEEYNLINMKDNSMPIFNNAIGFYCEETVIKNLDDLCNEINEDNKDNITEKKIQRLKSYKNIKLSNVDSLLEQLPDKIEGMTSPNLNVKKL